MNKNSLVFVIIILLIALGNDYILFKLSQREVDAHQQLETIQVADEKPNKTYTPIEKLSIKTIRHEGKSYVIFQNNTGGLFVIEK